jgi:dTDP-4-dehydrorhamnose 3,5-epimerase
MLITPLSIPDVKILTPRRFSDERGYFVEVFNITQLLGAGLDFQPVQENQSYSRVTGTVRGLHFQRYPVPQAKIVRVLRGRIFDVAVDIRSSSKTYRKWVAAELTADSGEQIFIPVGFAHGFCTLEPDTEIAYLVDGRYSPECDAALSWKDPELAIDWPTVAGAVVSAKDGAAPLLSEIDAPFA